MEVALNTIKYKPTVVVEMTAVFCCENLIYHIPYGMALAHLPMLLPIFPSPYTSFLSTYILIISLVLPFILFSCVLSFGTVHITSWIPLCTSSQELSLRSGPT